MTTTTPTPTPIAIHFQMLLLGSAGPAVGDVIGVAGLKRARTSEMLAPITVSRADLWVITMFARVLRGRTEKFPIKSPRGCCM